MNQLWTTKEVAAHTRLSCSTISHYVSDGKIPYKKIGRAVRFDPAAIDAWIEAGGPGSPGVYNK